MAAAGVPASALGRTGVGSRARLFVGAGTDLPVLGEESGMEIGGWREVGKFNAVNLPSQQPINPYIMHGSLPSYLCRHGLTYYSDKITYFTSELITIQRRTISIAYISTTTYNKL
jgi:hypothetical protein